MKRLKLNWLIMSENKWFLEPRPKDSFEGRKIECNSKKSFRSFFYLDIFFFLFRTRKIAHRNRMFRTLNKNLMAVGLDKEEAKQMANAALRGGSKRKPGSAGGQGKAGNECIPPKLSR